MENKDGREVKIVQIDDAQQEKLLQEHKKMRSRKSRQIIWTNKWVTWSIKNHQLKVNIL